MMTTTFLSELERLKSQATEGPWYRDYMSSPDGHALAWLGNNLIDTMAPKVDGSRYKDPEDDAELICFLVNHADAIAELVRAAEKLNQWNAKYPSSRIYTEGKIRRIAAEMDAINLEVLAAIDKLNGVKS
jgi:hypothetical protein